MVRLFAASAIALGCFSVPGMAQITMPPTMANLASCDHQAPVCGVMSRNRLVPYADECEARAAGATKVLFGACYDED